VRLIPCTCLIVTLLFAGQRPADAAESTVTIPMDEVADTLRAIRC